MYPAKMSAPLQAASTASAAPIAPARRHAPSSPATPAHPAPRYPFHPETTHSQSPVSRLPGEPRSHESPPTLLPAPCQLRFRRCLHVSRTPPRRAFPRQSRAPHTPSPHPHHPDAPPPTICPPFIEHPPASAPSPPELLQPFH